MHLPFFTVTIYFIYFYSGIQCNASYMIIPLPCQLWRPDFDICIHWLMTKFLVILVNKILTKHILSVQEVILLLRMPQQNSPNGPSWKAKKINPSSSFPSSSKCISSIEMGYCHFLGYLQKFGRNVCATSYYLPVLTWPFCPHMQPKVSKNCLSCLHHTKWMHPWALFLLFLGAGADAGSFSYFWWNYITHIISHRRGFFNEKKRPQQHYSDFWAWAYYIRAKKAHHMQFTLAFKSS